ncbi:MAG: globin domain-containing protein [Caulobacteraceae bacterium]
MDSSAITQSFEAVAEHGDPATVVYRRLFEAYPETRELFIMGEAAKGHMLDEVFAVVFDFVDARVYAPHFMRSEIVNHEGMGVSPATFMEFFPIVRDGLREVAAHDWTPAMESAWADLLVELRAAFLTEA